MPPLPPALLLSTTFPSSFPSLFQSLGLAAWASANTPAPPIGQHSEGRGRRPPSPTVVGGGSATAPDGRGEDRGRLCAPPDQATRHTGVGGRKPGELRGGSGPGRCGRWLGLGWLRGRGLRLQPRGGPGAARGLGQFTSLQWGPAHITGAAARRRRRAPLGCRVSCLLLLLGPPA